MGKSSSCTKTSNWKQWLDTIAYVVAIIAIAGSLFFFSHRPALRVKADATRTRAYSLSEQTKSLLTNLEGNWMISIVFVEQNVDRATLKQVDEVIERFRNASDLIDVERIDPTDPKSISQYEGLVRRLRGIFSEDVVRYEGAISNGRDGFNQSVEFVQREAQRLNIQLNAMPSDHALRESLNQIMNGFVINAQNGKRINGELDKSMDFSEAKPIPDYEAARDILVATLLDSAQTIARIAAIYSGWVDRPGLDISLKAYLASSKVDFDKFATKLQTIVDPLIHLRPLDLTRVGRELAKGEAAVITSQDRAAVIPAWQLFPISTTRFDQRFRGEQIIASTIQSLLVEQMPRVVFVHAQPESMLKKRQDGTDLFGVSAVLKAARYDVTEWNVTQSIRPEPVQNQKIVWIICPPPFARGISRAAFNVSDEEKNLVEATRMLLIDGESVLFNGYPSTLHKFKVPDPWQGLLTEFGLEIDTARLIFEKNIDGSGGETTRSAIEIVDLKSDHPIARAASGQAIVLPKPVQIEIAENIPSGVSHYIIAEAEPQRGRWLEDNWTQGSSGVEDPEEDELFTEPLPIMVGATRRHPFDQGDQRILVVGSVEWMFSQLADLVVPIGGDRVALAYPGNIELMQASVAWLAEMDDLIAQSPTSRQVSRLKDVTDSVRLRWRWITIVVMPGCCLLVGIAVWIIRRK